MKIVKVEKEEVWKARQSALWPNKPLSFVKIENDDEGEHYAVRVDHQIVSVISLFIVESGCQFRKFATLPSYQRQGIGTFLLKEAIKIAKLKNVTNFWCRARVEKVSFYENFGLRAEGEVFTSAGKDYILMRLSL